MDKLKLAITGVSVAIVFCGAGLSGEVAAQTAPSAPASTVTAQSGDAADLARRFGAREDIRQISLSPDGKLFAALQSGGARAVYLITGPVDGSVAPKRVANSSGDPDQLTSCDWANNERLVCALYTIRDGGGQLLGFSRLMAINADGSNLKLLTASPGANALEIVQDGGDIIDWFGDPSGSALLMTQKSVAEYSTGTHLANQSSGLGVVRVDPVSLKRSVVEAPNQKAVEYITDGIGNVRIEGMRGTDSVGYAKAKITYLYRKRDSRSWLPLSTVGIGTGFDPYAVDPATNVAYGFDTQDGRRALFKVALDGSDKRDLVFARPDVDIDGLVRIGRQHRVVGVTFSTDRRQTAFFDPDLKKLGAALSKALPNLPLVSFVDASVDEQKLLLWVGSDVDPGQYMLFDKSTRHLEALLPTRPPLNGIKLATVKSITYPAADGTRVPAYLTLPPGSDGKNIPAIVMPHGGPSARDEWGFDWLAQFFAARGYAVLQPNYRGSSGYGDAWFQKNGFKSWRTAMGDINDGGRWMITQGITAPDKLAIVGWSYGGYAALQTAVLDPNLFKAIVAIAPVTDLNALREEARGFTNFLQVDAFIGSGPEVREGSPAQNIAAIKAPVLMFHGTRDQNVGVGESRLMATRLKAAGKPVELVEFPGLAHQLDDSDARAQMLAKADAFLRASMKLPQ